MNPANKNNSGASAATSTTPAANESPGQRSEADYLHRQAELAAKAFSLVAQDLADDVRHLVSPAGWTRRHPKTVVGVAIAAGAVAAVLLGRRPAKRSAANRSIPSGPPAADKAKATLFSAIFLELFTIAKPLLSQLFAQLIKPQPQHEKSRPRDRPAAEVR